MTMCEYCSAMLVEQKTRQINRQTQWNNYHVGANHYPRPYMSLPCLLFFHDPVYVVVRRLKKLPRLLWEQIWSCARPPNKARLQDASESFFLDNIAVSLFTKRHQEIFYSFFSLPISEQTGSSVKLFWVWQGKLVKRMWLRSGGETHFAQSRDFPMNSRVGNTNTMLADDK